MGTGPKIMIFKLREIVYTLILAFFIITLILCLILMFSKKDRQTDSGGTQNTSLNSSAASTEETKQTTYTAGIYSAPVTLGSSAIDVQVTVSSNRILSIDLINLNESVETAYPLIPSALEQIASQILEKQKLDGITCSTENRYTSQLLLNAISKALSIAENSE